MNYPILESVYKAIEDGIDPESVCETCKHTLMVHGDTRVLRWCEHGWSINTNGNPWPKPFKDNPFEALKTREYEQECGCTEFKYSFVSVLQKARKLSVITTKQRKKAKNGK